MRGVRSRLGQQQIEPVLWLRNGSRYVEAELLKSWRANRHEQGRDRVNAGGQIDQALADQVTAREPHEMDY